MDLIVDMMFSPIDWTIFAVFRYIYIVNPVEIIIKVLFYLTKFHTQYINESNVYFLVKRT